MKTPGTIRSIVAMLLLAVALLGSTPKKYLHDALAGHSDVSYGFKGEGKWISATTYQCGFDHQVAESPYTGANPVQLPALQVVYHSSEIPFFYTDPAAGFHANAQSRGPPQG
ncbi:hypothetical protein [Paracnuella aquatica]|uniref:hypothetical protein n=1 Tax=Paracnuella aquatica TaxID=2268757 RepID=UPI000F50FB68|nr:hypothetical protein [Paracnuella aquatica]RPD46764.1 hypothetical protein DRJ53_13600 [Paracnuella aquatica]